MPIRQPTMTPDEFREAQHQLGLSDADLAHMLGIKDEQHIRRLKAPAGTGHHRTVQGHHARLLRAYLDGYRPTDWPA